MKKTLLFGRKRTKDLAQDHQLTDEAEGKKDELLALKLKAMHAVAQSSGRLMELPVELLRPDPNQPRKTFQQIEGLAASIKAKGVIQPIVIAPRNDEGFYTIIAGERRYHAAKQAGVAVLPCIVRQEENDANVMILQLLENDQREGVSPLEEAQALARLVNELGVSKGRLAEELGRDSAWISIRLGLLQASDDIKSLVDDGVIEDVRTLHELRKLEQENPKVAGDMMQQFRQNQVSGSYRQVISQTRQRIKTAKQTPPRKKRIQHIELTGQQLLLHCGGKHPVVFELPEAVLEAFLESQMALSEV